MSAWRTARCRRSTGRRQTSRGRKVRDAPLGDYSADRRIILLTAMAAAVGVISAFVALALVRLIGLFTNLAYCHRLDTGFATPAASHPGLWSLPIPVVDRKSTRLNSSHPSISYAVFGLKKK